MCYDLPFAIEFKNVTAYLTVVFEVIQQRQNSFVITFESGSDEIARHFFLEVETLYRIILVASVGMI